VAFERRTLRLDLPVMTAAALLLYVLSLDHTLRPLDGWLLVCGGVAYTWVLLWASRRERAAEGVAEPVTDDGEERRPRPFRSGAELVVGLGIIVVGAELLVDGAVASAESLGVSKAVIGLTVVAIGTSAPELVTTLVSTRRGDRDIAVGNLLGSSIYNIVFVLGVTVIVAPSGVPVPHDVLTTDLILMVVVAVVAIPVFVSGARISRVEGGVFVAAYLGYMTWLLVART
jgi:cation:H+ antiporter